MKKNIFYLMFTVLALLVITAPATVVNITGLRNESINVIPPERIVLITIDTLRADHLSCYGYPRKTSPFIDSLAENGVRFRRLVASASLTAPTHASIFTSLYPMQHNLLRNGHKLDLSFTTMAELLSSAGYQTAGFVSTDMHFKVGNMDQGFKVFNEPEIREARRLGRLRERQAEGSNNGTTGLAGSRRFYRQADKTVDKAIEWLDKKSTEDRFFMWVHLFDVHMPYSPPPEFLEKFQKQTESERASFTRFLLNEQHLDLPDSDNDEDFSKMLEMVNSYDAEIRFVDHEIERLYGHFKKINIDVITKWM